MFGRVKGLMDSGMGAADMDFRNLEGRVILFSDPFRPFFLFGALVAALAVPYWLVLMFSGLAWSGAREPVRWHIHEMLFGYLAAVLAGFLFTAIPNWTGRLPLRGGALICLFLLWLAGRIFMVAPVPPMVALVVDSLFLIVIAGLAWREVLVGKNWRNTPICLLVSLLAAANILFQVDDTAAIGQRLGFAVAALLIALVGGRVTPSFTRNWLAERGQTSLPAPFGAYDKVCVAALVLTMGLWTVDPSFELTGWCFLLTAGFHGWRLIRWRGVATFREPLVTALHLGYLWLVLALGLMGCAVLWPHVIGETAALHGLSAGAVGTMTLAVMTRASLGHSGRALKAGPATIAIYLMVTVGALFRIIGPALPMDYVMTMGAAAFFWSGAFALFAVTYGPNLIAHTTKADEKPGQA